MKHVVVVGAGVAGLTTAHHLSAMGHDVVVLEASDRPGGRVRTELVAGHTVDLGATFISSFYNATRDLCSELGIDESLMDRSQGAAVVRNGATHTIWPLKELVRSSGLSTLSKVRMATTIVPLCLHWDALEISDLRRGMALDKETADAFLARYAGGESVDYFFAPLARGLLYWNVKDTSTAVMLAILKAFATGRGTFRLSGGMSGLVDALATDAAIVPETRVTSVVADGNGFILTSDTSRGEQVFTADAVVCATTASVARQLCPEVGKAWRNFLETRSYTRTVVFTFEVDPSADAPSQATVFGPDESLLASINPIYGGQGEVARNRIKVCLSDAGFELVEGVDDAHAASLVTKRLTSILPSAAWPSTLKLLHLWRWHEALPRFSPDSIRLREAALNSEQATGLFFAGDYIGGPYLDGAVRSGLDTARRVNDFLSVREMIT